MKIMYVGNFDLPHRTEVYVTHGLRQLGHEVIEVPENKLVAPLDILRGVATVDFVLFSKTKSRNTEQVIQALQKAGILTVCWQWDLYNIPQRMQFPKEYACDLVFSTDGCNDSLVNLRGIKHQVLRQGIHEPHTIYLPGEVKYPIVFIGHSNGKFQPSREALLTTLRRTYGGQFHYFNDLRGMKLNEVLGQSEIVVGDSYPVDGGHYWSNRIYEVTGRGGFLLHPRVEGLEQEFVDGEHYVGYGRADFNELHMLISYYLYHKEAREQIRAAGHLHTRTNYTYTKRCESLIAAVSSRLTSSSASACTVGGV